MTVLLRRIIELERLVKRLEGRLFDMRRSRDMWRTRALSYSRGGAGGRRRKVA